MRDVYVPQRLSLVKREIEIKHKESKNFQDIKYDSELEEFIRELLQIDEKYLKVKAYSLSDTEIRMLVAYLPINCYHVDMYNLFEIYKAVSTKETAEILYTHWQNSYNNLECNSFMQVLCLQDDNFVQMLEERNISKDFFRNILNENTIEKNFIKELKCNTFQENKAFDEKLKYYGIMEDSRLFQECENLYFTECEEKEYLEISKEKLLELVKNYGKRDNDLLYKFLKNFLEKVSLSNLIHFKEIEDYFQCTIGDNSTQNKQDKYERAFRTIPENLEKKYQDWINIYKLDQYFGHDERSLFWKEYRMNKVTKNSKNQTVVIEFDSYVVVEFLGQGMGPMYLYDKEYYNNNLRWHVMYGKDSEIRRFLLHESKFLRHEIHRPPYKTANGWDKKFHGILTEEFHITEHLVF